MFREALSELLAFLGIFLISANPIVESVFFFPWLPAQEPKISALDHRINCPFDDKKSRLRKRKVKRMNCQEKCADQHNPDDTTSLRNQLQAFIAFQQSRGSTCESVEESSS